MGSLVFQATLGGTTTLTGPNIAGNNTFTLPSADGTNGQALRTNGSGVLSFGTLGTGAGGTGLTSFTANGVVYASSTSALTTGSALTFDGVNLGVGVASPGFPVDIQANASALGLRIRGRATGNLAYLAFRNNANSADTVVLGGQDAGLTFDIAGSEQMRLTSTGLGIGTSSPGYKLTVNGSMARTVGSGANGGFVVNDGTNDLIAIGTGGFAANGGTATDGGLRTTNNMVFATGSGTPERMRLDTSGNLGLGVTPSAWGAANKAIQFGRGFVQTDGSGTGSSGYGRNAYQNGSWYYQANGYANMLNIETDGAFKFFTAPSGTAGNAISFTQAMTLDASGNLSVGTTSLPGRLNVYEANNLSSVQFYLENGGTSDVGIRIRRSSSDVGFMGNGSYCVTGGGSTNFGIQAVNNLLFATGGSTERARITSGGEVYIAGTTDQGAYNLQVNGTGVWGAGAYVNGSDARLKENVQTLTDGLSVVTQLRPVTFQYKADYSKDTAVQPGFIAQELQQAMAGKDYVDGVVQAGPEYLNVAYQSLIPVLTKAIQELNAKVEALTAEIQTLKGN